MLIIPLIVFWLPQHIISLTSPQYTSIWPFNTPNIYLTILSKCRAPVTCHVWPSAEVWRMKVRSSSSCSTAPWSVCCRCPTRSSSGSTRPTRVRPSGSGPTCGASSTWGQSATGGGAKLDVQCLSGRWDDLVSRMRQGRFGEWASEMHVGHQLPTKGWSWAVLCVLRRVVACWCCGIAQKMCIGFSPSRKYEVFFAGQRQHDVDCAGTMQSYPPLVCLF